MVMLMVAVLAMVTPNVDGDGDTVMVMVAVVVMLTPHSDGDGGSGGGDTQC